MMKDLINQHIEENRQNTIELGRELFNHPELGFKELETRRIIKEYLAKHKLNNIKEFSVSGLSVTIGSGKPHIGIMAELDAIPTAGHPCASKTDNAAHACGHSSQCAIMLAALDALNQQINKLQGTVTLFFSPAEEFTDIPYRQSLIEKGEIRYLSGKENMLADHMFDDVDCIIHLHSCSETDQYRFSVGSTLAGFIYKKITFHGVASHAAVCPELGVNALNMCNLYLTAVSMLRETFKDEDMVRVHGIINDGGSTVNSIPDHVVYECYVRSDNQKTLIELNEKLTNTAKHCAAAIGGSCDVQDIPGYFPLHQSNELNEVILDSILQFTDLSQVKLNEKSIAGGDVGDISMFKPIVQYGYTGVAGRMHGSNMYIKDENEVYIVQAKVVADAVIDLLQHPEKVEHIVNSFKPKLTYQQYIDYLEKR